MAGSTRVIHGAALALFVTLAAGAAANEFTAPPTRVEPVRDTYFGTTVADPYRWLENVGAPETTGWFQAQNALTRSVLDALPGRAALRERLLALNAADVRMHGLQWAGGRLFYLKRRPGEQTYKLYVREGIAGDERLLIDPELAGERGLPASIDYYRASPNGKRLAYGLSLGGSENSVLRVIDVASQHAAGEAIPRARWASPVWRFDSQALFYTQQRDLPPGTPIAETLRGSRAMLRTWLGDGSTRDTALLGAGLNPDIVVGEDDLPSLDTSPVSPFVIGVVQHGVQREVTLFFARLTDLADAKTPWRRLAGPQNGITGFDLRGEWIYLVSNERDPRQEVVRWSLNEKRPYAIADAEVVVAPSARIVTGLGVGRDALYVQQLDAGYGRLLRLEYNVKVQRAPQRRGARGSAKGTKAALPKTAGIARATEIRLPFPGSISERVTDPLQAGAMLRLSSWTESSGYFTVDGKSGAIARTALLPPATADFSSVTSTQIRVRSHDGVEVPVSLVYRKGTPKDGSARVLLDAYGAYGIAQEPFFSPSLLAWLERGGMFAVAHVRGGGELGKDWHRSGYKATKANTWRDAIAAAQWLVGEGWTTPARLAITGGSAGGIAAGNAIIDRPDLFAAMVSQVGFHDTLRGETGQVGPANTFEFGSVATEQGFRDLLAMSSYARLADGGRYPAVLLTTGFNDPRVDAWDPAKMAARLQAINGTAGGSGKPVLLRVDFASGHGAVTVTQLVDEFADVFAFLLWQTGAAEFAPR